MFTFCHPSQTFLFVNCYHWTTVWSLNCHFLECKSTSLFAPKRPFRGIFVVKWTFDNKIHCYGWVGGSIARRRRKFLYSGLFTVENLHLQVENIHHNSSQVSPDTPGFRKSFTKSAIFGRPAMKFSFFARNFLFFLSSKSMKNEIEISEISQLSLFRGVRRYIPGKKHRFGPVAKKSICGLWY